MGLVESISSQTVLTLSPSFPIAAITIEEHFLIISFWIVNLSDVFLILESKIGNLRIGLLFLIVLRLIEIAILVAMKFYILFHLTLMQVRAQFRHLCLLFGQS